MKTRPRLFNIRRDNHGYADGILYRGRTVLHLMPGTCRNADNVQWIVDCLNGNYTKKPKER